MKFPSIRILVPVLLASFASGCLTASSAEEDSQVPSQEVRHTPWQPAQAQAQVVEPGTLFSRRDGSVVEGQSSGSVAVDEPQRNREVGEDTGSRMYLLERFQETVEENESLQFEVQGLAAALEKTEARVAELETQLSELQQGYDARGAEVESLKNDNLALAERLTTAQIRRLQAEKLLIEAKLDWEQMRRMTEGELPADLPAEASAGRAQARGGSQ